MKIGDRVVLLKNGVHVVNNRSGLQVGNEGTVELVRPYTKECENIMVLFDNYNSAQALSSDEVQLIRDSKFFNNMSLRVLRRQ